MARKAAPREGEGETRGVEEKRRNPRGNTGETQGGQPEGGKTEGNHMNASRKRLGGNQKESQAQFGGSSNPKSRTAQGRRNKDTPKSLCQAPHSVRVQDAPEVTWHLKNHKCLDCFQELKLARSQELTECMPMQDSSQDPGVDFARLFCQPYCFGEPPASW